MKKTKIENKKIASPLSRINETPKLAKAGADEFYCAVAPKKWHNDYGFVESISRRNSPSAHLKSINELEKVAEKARKYGAAVHVALNEAYHKEQIEFLLKQVKRLEMTAADGIILGDPASLIVVRKSGYKGKIIIGTGGTAFNTETVKFYKRYGVSRIILPRHLTIAEIRQITAADSSLEYEAFVFRGLCPFIDGLCRFQHGVNETLDRRPKLDLACGMKFRIKTITKGRMPECNREIKRSMSPRQSLTGCALCALYDLLRIPGLTALKIVGREFSSNEKLENLKMVRGVMDLLLSEPSVRRPAFNRYCRDRFVGFFGRECMGFDCYHPVWK